MAKYPVKCEKCGADHIVELFGKVKYRYMKLGIDSEDELPVAYGSCSDCEEKEFKEYEKKIKQENDEKGLPQLTGTEKQIAYAEALRKKEIERTEKYIQKMESLTLSHWMEKKVNEDKEKIKYLYNETNAGKVINTILRG